MKNTYVNLLKEIKKKKDLAVATIIETKGSAPQISGASAVFSTSGLLLGTLGGGILEASAQNKALDALKDKRSSISGYDLTSGSLTEEQAVCGGEVRILIDASPEKHLETYQNLADSYGKRVSGVLATTIHNISDPPVQISRQWIENRSLSDPDTVLPLTFSRKEMLIALSEARPKLLNIQENLLFLEPVAPSPQLLIAGAGHIGQALAHLGNLLNFEVTVIDDRADYANSDRIPDADRIIVNTPGKALQKFPISSDSYIVIVTRGHRQDAETLKSCIASPAAYLGMIGSRRKIALMREKFINKGWASGEEFDRVHAPIGLAINSITVEEIAISIAAQLVLVRSERQDTKQENE
jgi:xanthine dehydrogenase accessory factor